METETRIQALAKHLECDIDEIEPTKYDDKVLQIGSSKYPSEYLVVTDEEADELWDESLDSYLDECVLPELPDTAQNYFDHESWKRDARMDGRGHSLSTYDGNEDDITITIDTDNGPEDETLYIFRTN